MKDASGSTPKDPLDLMSRITEFPKTLYLFGKSDIPVAVLPSVRNEEWALTHAVLSNDVDGYSPRTRWIFRHASDREGTSLEPITFAYLPGMYKVFCGESASRSTDTSAGQKPG